ncbi:MAG: hypothetical protein AB7S26_31390 [Sandaracinaceae bacterium]
MSIEMSGNVRGWFHERLQAAFSRTQATASAETEMYLVELLARHAERANPEALLRPLALMLADALEAEGPDRLRRLRELGDTALYVLGFFEDHLQRRGVSRDYVVSMGGRAYARAEVLSVYVPSEAVRRDVYGELADGFATYAEAFDEVRESTVLRTPQDIVRLYEKWKRTKSPRVAERLRSEGVFPMVEDDSELLH